MNPIAYIARRPMTTLFVVVAAIAGGIFGLNKMRADEYPPGETPKVYVYLDYLGEHAMQAKEYVASRVGSYFHKEEEERHEEHHKIVVTSSKAKDIVVTQQYVCQIHSKQHINVCAYDNGYLEEILVKEGQTVKKGDPLFKIVPVLYQAKLKAEIAERDLAQLELENTRKLYEKKVVSQREVLLLEAKLAKAQAKADLAIAELNFTNVTAPFDGIVDRLHQQLGSLIKEGEILTTLSDNSLMWVYFNVPEADYLKYMAERDQNEEEPQIELMLAGDRKFDQPGNISTIEAKFNNETGNISFRADFPNPKRLLRHGQTGTVLIHRVLHNAVVIPQRATFEVLDKKYAYVVDEDDVVHQRGIVIEKEMDDIYVIKNGINEGDRIVLEGIRQVRDGEKVEFEFSGPEEVAANLKNKAE